MAQRPGDITRADDDTLDIERTDENYNDDTDTLEAAADDSDGTEEIKAKIEETRAGMGETIDAIQEKLSFSNLSEQVSEHVNNAIETAKDSVYEATIGKVAHFMKNTGKELSNSSLIATAKENPLPFLLIGVGAGLLAYQGFGRGSRARRSNEHYGSQPRLMGRQGRGDSSSLMDKAQGGLSTVSDTISNTAGTVKESVSNAASSTYSGVTSLASKAGESASQLGSKAAETYEHYMEEKPWAIGAVALVAGAAIGMAIPSTRYEGQIMGEARMNLMNKVTDTASEFVDKAKQAATEVGKTVTETVSEEARTLADKTLG